MRQGLPAAVALQQATKINTMENFLLLIREDLKSRQEMMQEGLQVMTKWVESLAQSGNYVGSEPLLNTGRKVARSYVLSDGPFIEAKEAISGYFLIRAENMEQAASIAQTCPLVLRDIAQIEVRQIMRLDSEHLS
jgi:hypothetical protein